MSDASGQSGNGSWYPKISQTGQGTFIDWLQVDEKSEIDERFAKKCECGADVTYGKKSAEFYHSYWCPLWKSKHTILPTGEGNE